MKSGQSKYGYGKSKELAMQGFAKGMTVSQVAKEYKMSYASVYNVFRRNGMALKNPDRKKHGFVKDIVLLEHSNGLTPREIITKHSLSKNSVYAVYQYCNLTPIRKQ
jgi:Mor family transcriptional regulator